MADILIERGTVITMDPQRRVMEDAAVAIEGERIVAVGPTAEVRARHPAPKVIDARRKVVMPGMVDFHAHLGGGLMKTLGEHLDGFRWRSLMEFVYTHVASVDWWRTEALINSLERLKFGVTAMYTMVGGSGTRTDDPIFYQTAAAAFEQIGVRARLGLAPARPPWPKEFSYWENGKRTDRLVSFEQVIDVCDQVLAGAQAKPSRTVDYGVALSRLGNPNPHDPMWSPERGRWVRKQAEAMRALMDKHGVGFWTHAYGNAIEYAHDEKLGLLGPNTILSHCTDITDRSIDILKETGAHVAHHPRARRIYSYPGRCPVVELIDAGVNVGLGADGPPPDRTCDVFLDMKVAITLQRLHFRDQDVMPPGKALEMATIDGYKALGLDHELGSIEVGKRADVIVVDLFKPHLTPFTQMPVHRVVYEATGQDVEDVIVNGRLVMQNRKMLTVDEAAILEQADEQSRRMVELAGLQPFLAMPDRFWGHARY